MSPLPVAVALSLVILLRLCRAQVPLSNPTLQFFWSVHWSWLDDHHSIFYRWPTASAEERWVCSVTLLSSCKRSFWLTLFLVCLRCGLGNCSGYASKLAVALRKATLFCRNSRAKHETKTFAKMRWRVKTRDPLGATVPCFSRTPHLPLYWVTQIPKRCLTPPEKYAIASFPYIGCVYTYIYIYIYIYHSCISSGLCMCVYMCIQYIHAWHNYIALHHTPLHHIALHHITLHTLCVCLWIYIVQ